MSEPAGETNGDHHSDEENRRVRIRTAIREDASTIAFLGADIQEIHHHSRPDWFRPANAQESVALYEELLANLSVTTFIAEDGAEALGFVLVRVHHRAETPLNCAQVVVDIDQIGVVPSARGRGVGHELMASVRDLANQVSADRILLTTWEFNTDAHRFFESEGLTTEMRRMSMPWPLSE